MGGRGWCGKEVNNLGFLVKVGDVGKEAEVGWRLKKSGNRWKELENVL